MAADALSTGFIFLWGGAGGLAGGILTFTVPWLTRVHEGDEADTKTLVAGSMLAVIHGVFGGFIAVSVGAGHPTDIGQAIAIGLAWPGFLKGAGESGRSISRRRRHDP